MMPPRVFDVVQDIVPERQSAVLSSSEVSLDAKPMGRASVAGGEPCVVEADVNPSSPVLRRSVRVSRPPDKLDLRSDDWGEELITSERAERERTVRIVYS